MIATKSNTTSQCERCLRMKPFVLATAFDGRGGFRFLCSACDRIEKDLHQLRLFETQQQAITAWLDAEPEPEEEVEMNEPEPPQMSLF